MMTIRAPENALRDGWRCCWVEAYSHEVARQLSRQFGKPVIGNGADVRVDTSRTEANLRQIAAGIFQGEIALGSMRPNASRVVHLYVHLYRPQASEVPSDTEHHLDPQYRRFALPIAATREFSRTRTARNFLEEPVLHFRVDGRSAPGFFPGAPPSQLAPPPSIPVQNPGNSLNP